MGFDDPFSGYSALLRTIIYVLVPLFGVIQFVRLRRALHVFQLEGYKRGRFIEWCHAHRKRAQFFSRSVAKKPLVMTGRAWRILVAASALSVLAVLVLPGLAHRFLGGWPADVATWAIVTAVVGLNVPRVLTAADWLLTPVQRAINGRFARAAAATLEDIAPLVIGVTGSFGKTSTKFAIAGVVGPASEVLATPSSFNTPLGISRTINEQLSPGHRYLVVEMGAYGVSEIAELARFVRPRVGVLTAIGPAHLERFGSMDAIRTAKYELIEALPEDGAAIMNVDDPEVRALADRTAHTRVLRYGLEPDGHPDITASDLVTGARGTSMTVRDVEAGEQLDVSTKLLGAHALRHVLAGVAVAKAAGVPLRQLGARIESLAPVEHRLQIIEGTGRITVIDDAYNSNPEGAAAALEVLEALDGNRKIVVTPGMIELGELQAPSNERFGEHAARVSDVVIFVATINRDALVSGARKAGRARVVTVDSLAEAQKELASLIGPGDVVLFENDLPDQYES